MRRAIYPGSFDPIHLGHRDVIARASTVFDEVVVAVSTNYAKKYLFPAQERLDLARESLAGLPRVRVEPMGQGLLANYAVSIGANAIVKGVRNAQDFAYEEPMALMNRQLGEIETVFLVADPQHAHLSSTLIKEVFSLGGDVSTLVSDPVLQALRGSSAFGVNER